ncbi:MAG: threonine--tRNA ligase [Candidatus Levybacteria bacterium]|nr:threonine--tRNA ligase [Candidatus Levybacteria bacterium]
MSKEHLEYIRHSTAHLLAAAVLKLYPKTKLTIGPAIENGFYYDFDFGDIKITDEDLPKIEEKMRQLLPSWTYFEGRIVSAKEANELFAENPYKLELIEELASKGDALRIYKAGDFDDLCRGGHSENPANEIGAFKLLTIAGAYWRGSEKNPMLTRIYGTTFPTKKELDEHLTMLEEAKKRDHRKLGKELGIFTTDDLVGPGLILWLPKGTIIREEIETFAKKTEKQYGYKRVATPHIAKKELFETSGHLPYYADSMFPPMRLDDGDYYLKAMNCPMTHLIFKHTPRSYRDLPLRFAEYGTVYRHELSGTLAGLLRVRGMSTNDAHIYCTREQIKEEFLKVMELHKYYYDIFGIKEYWMRLSLHDPNKKGKYFDNPKLWEFTEQSLREAMRESGLPFEEAIGEAAFYGPKVDFQIKSVIGREETASTNQLDFIASERFGLKYVDSNGQEKPVFVIHRAPLGTHERFVAFLLEHYAGKFPVWLSPVQVVVIPIANRHQEAARKANEELQKANIRSEVDDRAESMQAKIRQATLQKVSYMGIIGDKEVQSGGLSIRTREGKDEGLVPLSNFIQKVKLEIDKKI